MKLSDIKPNDQNPRTISEAKMKALVKSITEFEKMLSLRPIIVDADGVILGGNMRYQALKQMGRKEIPDEWVKRAADLTEEEKREFIIKDNVGFGEWDWDALANDWNAEQLTEWGLDVPDWTEQQGEAQEDDFEIPDEVKTDIVPGDLIEIGRHRLLCGDSADSDEITRLMNSQKADMVFTDPPYGVAIGAKNRMLNSFQPSGRNLKDIKDDALAPEQLKERLLPAFNNLHLAMAPCCTVFVTAPQGGDLGMMMMMMKEAGLPVRHMLIWKKNAPTFSMGRLDYDYQHEPILLTWNKSHKFYGNGKHKTSVWEIAKPMKSKEHPTMKPVELVANALLNNSLEAQIVIDWYLGSGTTMIAAHQLNRTCYGMEIDPKYCQVIIDRMLKLDPAIEVKINGKAYGARKEAATD